ncbi:hypothetical protein [Demequina capsici]|uniref:Secreted protein n=1 Tax=Demequina capsici TaxID=3075620 RepID=A0AA96F678_9MICO|nr:hypothetical protein [Demequina sp. OYTSA14]WNM24588.1 hypothetical protein RN606_00110 [Demequina sp. OYTSA14]
MSRQRHIRTLLFVPILASITVGLAGPASYANTDTTTASSESTSQNDDSSITVDGIEMSPMALPTINDDSYIEALGDLPVVDQSGTILLDPSKVTTQLYALFGNYNGFERVWVLQSSNTQDRNPGTSRRVLASKYCASTALTGWRVVVDVDVIGYADPAGGVDKTSNVACRP